MVTHGASVGASDANANNIATHGVSDQHTNYFP
jgi:hypothetical protein